MSGSEPTFPTNGKLVQGTIDFGYSGLTKRELFAAMAMVARHLVPNPRLPSDYAREAVEMADLLLAELEKKL